MSDVVGHTLLKTSLLTKTTSWPRSHLVNASYIPMYIYIYIHTYVHTYKHISKKVWFLLDSRAGGRARE